MRSENDKPTNWLIVLLIFSFLCLMEGISQLLHVQRVTPYSIIFFYYGLQWLVFTVHL